MLFLIALFICSNAAAQSTSIDSNIRPSCNANEESLISISSLTDTTGHPAEPGYYSENVCVRGIENVEIKESCLNEGIGFYISSRKSNAHFSNFEGYNLRVCADNMEVEVRNTCLPSETALFSVSSAANGHVAEPGFYTLDACASYSEPQSVALNVEFNLSSDDEVYFDDTQVNGEQTYSPPAEFPYLISEGNGRIAGVVAREFTNISREIPDKNRLEATTQTENANYIIPFTDGSHETIERRQQLVLGNRFVSSFNPSFAYFITENPEVRVAFRSDIDVKSNLSLEPGTHVIKLEKTDENQVRIYRSEE